MAITQTGLEQKHNSENSLQNAKNLNLKKKGLWFNNTQIHSKPAVTKQTRIHHACQRKLLLLHFGFVVIGIILIVYPKNKYHLSQTPLQGKLLCLLAAKASNSTSKLQKKSVNKPHHQQKKNAHLVSVTFKVEFES